MKVIIARVDNTSSSSPLLEKGKDEIKNVMTKIHPKISGSIAILMAAGENGTEVMLEIQEHVKSRPYQLDLFNKGELFSGMQFKVNFLKVLEEFSENIEICVIVVHGQVIRKMSSSLKQQRVKFMKYPKLGEFKEFEYPRDFKNIGE